MSGSMDGDLKMTVSARTKLQTYLASALEYTTVLSTHCQWRQMVCIFDKKKNIPSQTRHSSFCPYHHQQKHSWGEILLAST